MTNWDMNLLHWVEVNFILLAVGLAWKLLATLTWHLKRKYKRGWKESAKLVFTSQAVFWAFAISVAYVTALMLMLIEHDNLPFLILVFASALFLVSGAIIAYPGIVAAEKKFGRD